MYVKNPIPVQAFQFGVESLPDWFMEAQIDGVATVKYPRGQCSTYMQLLGAIVEVDTSYGVQTAKYGDWVIKNWDGTVYTCDEDIFDLNYSKIK